MTYRVVHRAGPWVVRRRYGQGNRAHIDTYSWIEGPGFPEGSAPANRYEAMIRHSYVSDELKLVDALAEAYALGAAQRNKPGEG